MQLTLLVAEKLSSINVNTGSVDFFTLYMYVHILERKGGLNEDKCFAATMFVLASKAVSLSSPYYLFTFDSHPSPIRFIFIFGGQWICIQILV